MSEITLEILNKERLTSYPGGGLKVIVADVKIGDKKVGTIDSYLEAGYKPYDLHSYNTTTDYYATIELAFKAGKVKNLFKQ